MRQKNSKIYIEYKFIEGPYGGANQFLKCLKNYFVREEIYTEIPAEADFILINHTNITIETMELKLQFPDKIFIHRMDGPVSKHRKRSKALDKQSFFLDYLLFNGTIFQSKWTEESCMEIGFRKSGLTAVIHNAPDPSVFYRKDYGTKNGNEKIKLVSTSWSPNWNKGFDILKYLDEHLDFEHYEYTFIGNTPIPFQNIQHIEALPSVELAKKLREQDIYIAVSKSESCSNSLLEAINCGLVVIARDSGCYKEIVGQGGEIACSTEEFIDKIKAVAENMDFYREKLEFFNIEEIGSAYYCFMSNVKKLLSEGGIKSKKLTGSNLKIWRAYVFYIKVYQKIIRTIERLISEK